jgi:hypothetical protein
MKIKHLPSLLCVLLFAAPACAAYQTSFTPRISVTGEYTDNVFLLPENEESDLITLVSPGFTLDVAEKTHGFTLSYDPAFSFYREYSENDTVRHDADLDAWADLSRRTRLELRNALLYTEDPVRQRERPQRIREDPLLPDDFTIRKNREPYLVNNSRIQLIHQFGREDSIGLGYSYYMLDNTDPTIEDRQAHSPFATLNYWFDNRYGIFAGLSYRVARFDVSDDFDEYLASLRLIRKFGRHLEGNIQYNHTVIDFEGGSVDYKIYEPSVGILYTFEKDSRIGLNLGYYYQDKDDGSSESGLIVNALVDRTWAYRTWSFKLGGGSGYEQTYFGAENLGFTFYYEGSGVLDYGFTRQLNSRIFTLYRKNEYRDQTPTRTDDLLRAGAGMTYLPTRWLALDLRYELNLVDSTVEINDYTENRAILTLTLTRPGEPIERRRPIRSRGFQRSFYR